MWGAGWEEEGFLGCQEQGWAPAVPKPEQGT